MNVKYNALYKKLINAIHPDKVGEELKEKATKLAALLNRARDKNDEAFVQRVWDLYQSGELWSWDPDSFYGSKEKAKASGSKESGSKEKKERTFTWNQRVYEEAESARDRDHLDRSRMAAWLNLFHGIRGAAAKEYLDKLFPAGEKGTRAGGYVADFYDRLAKGPMSDSEFKDWIKAGSTNRQRHESHWDAVRKMANRIWASK